jgi:hypothetical protein
MPFAIVPIIGTGSATDSFRPKYVAALPVAWSMVDHEDTAICWLGATQAQMDSIAANADAWVVPPLDNLVDDAATEVALEAQGIPAQWVRLPMTYRQVLRIVVGMAQLQQRAAGQGVRLRLRANRGSTISMLPVAQRLALAQASDSLGLDRSTVTQGTTVRAALRVLGQQFAEGRGVSLGDL